MSKHTKGPWQECGHERGGCICGLVFAKGADVAIADCSLSTDEELRAHRPSAKQRKANARLIAASPCLLDALRQVKAHVVGTGDEIGLALIDPHGEVFSAVCSAIAKATGAQT